jgi:conjugal transfer ATP-binding protein TraC
MKLSNLKSIYAGIANACGLAENVESENTSTIVDKILAGTFALDDYLSYRYFDEENNLFLSDGNICGFMLEISPIVGVDDSVHKNLSHFFNDELPEYSYLQFLLVASHDVEDILSHWQEARTNSSPLLDKITKRRAQFVRERAMSFGVSDGRIARDYRIFVSFSQIIDTKNNTKSGITSFRDSFINKLESLQLAPRTCDAIDLIRLVRTMLQMELSTNTSASYNPLELLSKQIVSPSVMQGIEDDRINHPSSGLVSRIYHIKELPLEFSLAETINLFGDSTRSSMGIPARFIISYSVSSNISKSGSAMITARGKKVIEASEKWYSNGNRDLKREAAEWQDINDRVTSNGERLLTEHWSLMITSTNASIDIVSQNLINLYNNNNFRLGISSNLQLPSLLSMLPMQQGLMWNILDKFKLTRLVLSKEVIARLPIHAEWKGVPKSGVLLHARRGQLFNFNPFYKISSGNYNICIFAPSGGGKSVFLQELAVSLMAQNTRMFILDIGQSFANICTLLDGEIIQFGRNAPFSLNPFASFYKGMSPDDKDEFLKCTKGLLEVMCGVGDDARGSAELEKAIVAALLQNNYKLDISSFAEFLETSESIILQKYGATLYPYTNEGLYGKYFSGTKQATFKRLITVFEFEEIKNDPKLLSIVLQILLMEVTNQFLTGDRQTPFMIIVDEAWMLLDFATSFFAAFVRTVRKYGGSLVICVQNFMDLHKTQEHRTILENSTWTILLKQDEKGLGAFKESEAFKEMIPLIKSISLSPNKYAEALLYTTGVTVIGKLVLDDYSKALFSTDPSDFNFLKNKTKEGISLDEAVEQLVSLKGSGKSIRA